jgi:hypothetical protein
MTKRYQTLGLALVAAFALSAVVAASAFATAAEWLVGGNPVTSATATKSTGKLLLEDTSTVIGKVAVICEGTLDGTVSAKGVDSITALLNASGVEVTLAAKNPLICTNQTNCSGGGEVYAEGLPWGTQLELTAGGTFIDKLTTVAAYNVTCTILGVKVTDECKALVGTETSVGNGAADVVLTPGVEALPHGECSAGNKESGVIETVEALTATETGTLQASE